MAARLRFIVAYDGAGFAGWQSQKHRNTVQDHLERAFQKIAGIRVRIHGSGRTDARVHALAQCAHVDLPNRRLTPIRWVSALNALLPPTIRVLSCRYVRANFHARFSATGKIYRYRIWAGPILPPLEFQRAWHLPARLDVNLVKSAAKIFVGTHDFAAFAANRSKARRRGTTDSSANEPETARVRTLRSVRVQRKGELITIEFDGTGFLYKMVRLMVGALAQVGLSKLEKEEIAVRLKSGHAQGTRFTAPAEGLYLAKIWY